MGTPEILYHDGYYPLRGKCQALPYFCFPVKQMVGGNLSRRHAEPY